MRRSPPPARRTRLRERRCSTPRRSRRDGNDQGLSRALGSRSARQSVFRAAGCALDETASRKFGHSVLTETLKRALTDRDKADAIDAVWRGLRGNSLHEGRQQSKAHDEMPIKKLIAHKTVYTGLR